MTRLGSSRDSTDNSITGHPHAVIQHHATTEHSKLLPWLMLIALLAGIALGASSLTLMSQSQNDRRNQIELDRQYRFLQELRIRVEDAEIAAEEVNPKFHPRHTE